MERESIYMPAEQTEQPPCYDERSTFREKDEDKFVFISYSHKDKDKVYADLKWLYERRLNFWYDKKLNVGDIWNEKALERIESENCLGAILFLSPSSAKSEAVNRELNKLKQLEKAIFPVIVGDEENLSGVLRSAYLSFGGMKDGEIEEKFPAERVKELIEAVSASRIFVKRSADGFEKLIASLKDRSEELFADDELARERFVSAARAQDDVFTLGEYPGEKSDVYAPSEGRFGEKYLALAQNSGGMSVFEFEPLQWRIVGNDHRYVLALSEKTIDACRRGEIEERLEEIKNAAFGEFAEAVASVSLPENGLLSMRGEMTDFAAARRKNSFFTFNWAKKGERSELCQNGEVVKIASVDEGGIRPLIAIDIKKFDALKGAQ